MVVSTFKFCLPSHSRKEILHVDIYGLGIESSCDETGIALLKNGNEVVSEPLYSQIDLHRLYGGVVPELASRAHMEKIPILLQEALSYLPAQKKISYIAVTVQPGLLGSLLVGFNTAMAISLAQKIPVIPIHHLEAHLYAVQLQKQQIEYPALGLLLSGGNSVLYLMEDLKKLTVVGDTLDDAAGEALDKAASLLKLSYPGGPHIEQQALLYVEEMKQKGMNEADLRKQNPLPQILKSQNREEFNFSFSGIKTALFYLLQKYPHQYQTHQLAYFFQERVIEITVRNIRMAIKKYKTTQLIGGGGVMANKMLRQRIQENTDIDFLFPPPKYCTDNAAMVASLGYNYFQRGSFRKATKVHSGNEFIF